MRIKPIFVFTYHKVGTVLMMRVLEDIAAAFGFRLAGVYGRATRVPDADIVVFAHSLIDFDLGGYDFRGVRILRDPRDIWLSAYLYHRHCTEKWCTNTDFTPTSPILFPKVPISLNHRPEPWKHAYLDALGGQSYQQNLLRLPQAEGLAFELERYTSWTIASMLAWRPHPAVLDVRMESIASDFDAAMTAIFRHLGIEGDDLARAVKLAARHDLARMSDSQIAADPHIHSRQLSKWRATLSASDLGRFSARFWGVPEALGYAR